MGHYFIDTCSFWVSNTINYIMSLQQIDFTKVINDEQVYEHVMANYDQLGKDWIAHQWKWMNAVYQAFKDHYKYLIIISLVEKTLQFYDQMNIKLNYDQFYSKSYLQIDKFNISELCEKLQLPKETVRRKVLELEKIGVLKRVKKQIIIDRNTFSFIKCNSKTNDIFDTRCFNKRYYNLTIIFSVHIDVRNIIIANTEMLIGYK